MKIVVSMGGSLLTRDLTSGNFKKYADAIRKLHKTGHKIVVVCGGGRTCREYQAIAKPFGAGRDDIDFIGIMATHLSASTFYSCLGSLGHLVRWKPLKEACREVRRHFGRSIIVAGGYDTGTSTDYDAACFASMVGADILINATYVDGVYDKDPRENPGARKFDRIGYDEFIGIIRKNEQSPGEYRLFDLKAARLIKKARLRTVIIDASDPEEIIRAIDGRHSGTEVSFTK